MEDRKNSNPDDLLDRAVDAVLRDPIPNDLPSDRVTRLAAVVQRAADQPYPTTLIERIKTMKSRTRLTVAAAILIAIVGLMFWLVPGSGTALAFADVAEALTNVRSAKWKTTTVIKRPQGETETVNGIGMFLAPSHERMERTERGEKAIGIVDGQKDRTIVLLPARKTAIVMDLKNLPEGGNPLGRTFQDLREFVTDARSGKAAKVERLGIEVVDGRHAEGFRMHDGLIQVTVWADPKTSLPIRTEESAAGESEIRSVRTQFEIGVDLDESLFGLDVPEGYVVQGLQMDFSKKGIAYMAETLGIAAEHNGGVFPPVLRGEQGINGIMRRYAATLEKKHGKDSPESLKVGSDMAMKMGATGAILYRLSPEHDWHYAGKDVKLNTPNRPIFWWKPKKGGNYEVIYADLSVKEVAPQDVPKVPQSEADSSDTP